MSTPSSDPNVPRDRKTEAPGNDRAWYYAGLITGALLSIAAVVTMAVVLGLIATALFGWVVGWW